MLVRWWWAALAIAAALLLAPSLLLGVMPSQSSPQNLTWATQFSEQFRAGMDVELEHGLGDAETNVTNDDPLTTGKIALAHLREFADYYTRLERMESEADDYWRSRGRD